MLHQKPSKKTRAPVVSLPWARKNVNLANCGGGTKTRGGEKYNSPRCWPDLTGIVSTKRGGISGVGSSGKQKKAFPAKHWLPVNGGRGKVWKKTKRQQNPGVCPRNCPVLGGKGRRIAREKKNSPSLWVRVVP